MTPSSACNDRVAIGRKCGQTGNGVKRFTFLPALFLLTLLSQAWADTLVLKSGENKKGKVVEEMDSLVLLKQEDGLVVPVQRSNISSLEKDAEDAGSPKDPVNAHSKKPHKLLAIGEGIAPAGQKKKTSGQGLSFDAITAFLERWLTEHPGLQKKMKDLTFGSEGQSKDLEKLAESAQQS